MPRAELKGRMVARKFLEWVGTIALIWLGASGAQAGDLKAASSGAWTVDAIGADIGAFSHVSLAVDPVSGAVFLSYYDAVNGDLRWARTVDSGGNCGPDNGWLCELVLTGVDVGLFNSIAVHPAAGGGSDYIIALYDANYERLLCVEGTANGATATAGLTIIDSGFAATDRTGMYTAVAYDDEGVPWIAYQNETYGNAVGTHRMIARKVGDGGGNCGEAGGIGDWECSDLFADGWAQTFSSTGIAVDDEGNPVVAYYDQHNARVVAAYYSGTGGTCGPSNSWRCHSVSARSGDTVIGPHVVPFVARSEFTLFYLNPHRDVLEQATYVGTSGNCGYNSTGTTEYEWQCDTIDEMSGHPASRSIAVTPDSHDYPVVAYQFGVDPGPAGLAVARPVASAEVDEPGNCGPSHTWYCQILVASPSLSEADSVAAAIDGRGILTIAYHELDEYPYPVEHNLKVAVNDWVIVFDDGFESGDRSAWSSSVP